MSSLPDRVRDDMAGKLVCQINRHRLFKVVATPKHLKLKGGGFSTTYFSFSAPPLSLSSSRMDPTPGS